MGGSVFGSRMVLEDNLEAMVLIVNFGLMFLIFPELVGPSRAGDLGLRDDGM